jgi:type III restriction enzyme
MPTRVTTGTREIPLRLARSLTTQVNAAWDSGELLAKTMPVTQRLLRFWFDEVFCEQRHINFHIGQRQAILNVIYAHEILKPASVFDLYAAVDQEALSEMDLTLLKREKYQHPQYCCKMATGTGKTWVLEALLIWQYLNAKYEEQPSGRYSKNFLIVTPGLIIYDRLLDAFLGKQNPDGSRDFDRSDFKQFESLFIPPSDRDTIFGFVQSSVMRKEEIGKKVTGDGFIAITNWHLLEGEEDAEPLDQTPLDNPASVIKDIFPIRPGTSAGHALESLDNAYLRGRELEFLTNLPDLVVFNDEAHHIHEIKSGGEIKEVEWQRSLNQISKSKGQRFIQIDFSATPYDVTGGGQRRTKHYFPHIIVDFDLYTAIHLGLVKTIALDKRKEIATMELDFRALRDGNRVIGLSDGQKLMLRAGLKKLKILEEQFTEFTKDAAGKSNKHPKMLVICEDTLVSPFVVDFLKGEGLREEDVIQIDSDKKGSVPQDEWDRIKQRLFDIDRHEAPKVIVSVLMLREGFDVNNICVIVPLRSTEAPILLEQIIGRGLRVMWREPEYQDIKNENRIRLLEKKEAPLSYLDILSIIEHPAFLKFYNDLIAQGLIGETRDELKNRRESVLGDMISVGLKKGYEQYDLFWPIILVDREEYLLAQALNIDKLAPIDWYSLEQLKRMVPKEGETFFSEEITVKTRFGEYAVTADLFTAKSYNEFLAKLVHTISTVLGRVGQRKTKPFPTMQINQAELVKLLDRFIRTRLFNQVFDPFENNNWRVLLLSKSGIVEHIIKEASKLIYELQNSVDVSESRVIKRYFSEVRTLRMRENFALDIVKTIYEKLPYPSHKGELEKNFMLFCDSDSQVQALLKINEVYHDFAHLTYIRTDGLLSSYYPDFIVKTKDSIYLVETKAQKELSEQNVKQKRLAALDWLNRVNKLQPEYRMDAIWSYVLLGEETFYNMKDRGASVTDILEYAKLSRAKIESRLF